jgi:hypothetical protein
MVNLRIIFILLLLLSVTFSQEFKELLPPENLIGNFSENSVKLEWKSPENWDSLKYNVFKATVFDTSNIVVDNLEFQIIANTKDTQIEEHYNNIENLSHLAFMYCVVAQDTNDVESLRSNYCLINIR